MTAINELEIPRGGPFRPIHCIIFLILVGLIGVATGYFGPDAIKHFKTNSVPMAKSKYHPDPFEIPLKVKAARSVKSGDYEFAEVDLAAEPGYNATMVFKVDGKVDGESVDGKIVWLYKSDDYLIYKLSRYAEYGKSHVIVKGWWNGQWIERDSKRVFWFQTKHEHLSFFTVE